MVAVVIMAEGGEFEKSGGLPWGDLITKTTLSILEVRQDG
jgi:hypothetical protein